MSADRVVSEALSADHPCEAYRRLCKGFEDIFYLFSMKEILEIDMLTFMPQGGVKQRTGQIANISRRVYREITDPVVERLLEVAEQHLRDEPDYWDEWNAANLREMRRIYMLFCSNPVELYAQASKISAEGRQITKEAQEQKKPGMLIPHFDKVLRVQREILAKKREKMGLPSDYEVVIDACMRGFNTETVDALVDSVMPEISSIYNDVKKRTSFEAPPYGEFSKSTQMQFSQKLLRSIGFDFSRGQVFVAPQTPALGGTPEDTRMLVRCVDGSDLRNLLEDTLFQGACALYIQNLPLGWNNQPVCEDMGSAMLEANGLLLETMLGRSREFFVFLAKFGTDVLDRQLDADSMFAHANSFQTLVEGELRGELSCLPYLAISYRIEKDLIEGTLSVSDLTQRWRQDCRMYLGEEPVSDMAVFEQNPGWLNGRFGLSLSKLIAHMIAAQLYQSILAEHADLPKRLEKGDFSAYSSWMGKNIWSKGRLYSVPDLIEQATGEKLSVKGLLQHLQQRFGAKP